MKKTIIAVITTLALSLTLFTGCGQPANENNSTPLASGGVLILSVNPEIAVEYDEKGLVTGVTARNDDALSIINSCEGLIGQQTRDTVAQLVTAIGNAGYFVEEIEGERRQIILEIEEGSSLPHIDFIDEVVEDIRHCINTNSWNVPMNLENESDFGITDFFDTDYGVDSDGVTDFDGVSDYIEISVTDYGTDYGTTDYATDYGVTDYDSATDYATDYGTDYGTDYDGESVYDISDYGDSDYAAPAPTAAPAPATPPVTVADTDYGTDYDGESAYDVSDYGDSDYAAQVAPAPTAAPVAPPPPAAETDYGTDYDSASDYDSESAYDVSDYGDSDYDDSDYGDSDYDD